MKERTYFRLEVERSIWYPFIFIAIAVSLVYLNLGGDVFTQENLKVYFGVGIIGALAVLFLYVVQWVRRKRTD